MIVTALLFFVTNDSSAQQTDLPKDVLQLSQIKRHMRQLLTKMPDYTCFETIYRSHRVKSAPSKLIDTLRLQVGFVSGKEVYAWPNEPNFGDTSPEQIVGAGTVSTGEFVTHARSVFVDGVSVIKYAGEEKFKGHDALKYDFRIGTFRSGWVLSSDGANAKVGSAGSFWADPETSDVLRLDVHATEIPAFFPIKEARTRIDYGRMRIGAGEITLPESSDLWISKTDGAENRNHVEFSQCRSYSAETTLHFDGEQGFDPAKASASGPAGVPVDNTILPPDLSLPLTLDAPISSESAHEGDTVMAHVRSDVELKHKVIVPKNAVVVGRIRRLENYSDPRPHYIVGLEFVQVEFGNKRALFLGNLTDMDQVPGLAQAIITSTKSRGGPPPPQLERGPGGTIIPMSGGGDAGGVTETLYTQELPGVGTFFMDGSKFALPAGTHMTFRTQVYKK